MTMPFDVFAQAAPESGAGDPQSAAAEWTQALADPRVRASMLSFSLQLMQPRAPGQSALGQVAQSIGNAGQTIGNIDELDRKDAEQARKERDTESQIDNRRSMSDAREQNANTAVMRADIMRQAEESRANLRAIQGQALLMKVQKTQAEATLLEQRAKLMPGDQEIKAALAAKKIELMQAQADLAAGRASVIPSVIERNQSSTRLNDARTASEPQKAEAAQQRIQGAAQKTYLEAKAEHDKTEGMKPRSQQKPFMSEAEFNQQRSKFQTRPGAAAPAQGPTVEPELPRDKKLWMPGKIYPTPRGPARYDGNDEWTLL